MSHMYTSNTARHNNGNHHQVAYETKNEKERRRMPESYLSLAALRANVGSLEPAVLSIVSRGAVDVLFQQLRWVK